MNELHYLTTKDIFDENAVINFYHNKLQYYHPGDVIIVRWEKSGRDAKYEILEVAEEDTPISVTEGKNWEQQSYSCKLKLLEVIDNEPNPSKKRPNTKIKNEIKKRDNCTCTSCKKSFNPKYLHVDHVISYSLGGLTEPNNLTTLCEGCHAEKTGKDKKERIELYRSRTDRTLTTEHLTNLSKTKRKVTSMTNKNPFDEYERLQKMGFSPAQRLQIIQDLQNGAVLPKKNSSTTNMPKQPRGVLRQVYSNKLRPMGEKERIIKCALRDGKSVKEVKALFPGEDVSAVHRIHRMMRNNGELQ